MFDYQKLKFNVLFKDIFLFYKKAFNSNNFDNFIDDFINPFYSNVLIENNDDLMEIINDADILENYDDSNKYLTSIFSKISLDDTKSKKWYVPLTKLVLNDDLYPVEFFNDDPDYRSLWDQFIKELSLLKDYTNFNNLFDIIVYTLFLYYTSSTSSIHLYKLKFSSITKSPTLTENPVGTSALLVVSVVISSS